MTMENNMGTDKISRLLLKTGIPLMLSLLMGTKDRHAHLL